MISLNYKVEKNEYIFKKNLKIKFVDLVLKV